MQAAEFVALNSPNEEITSSYMLKESNKMTISTPTNVSAFIKCFVKTMALTLGFSVLVACGGGSGSSETTPKQPPTNPAPAPDPAPEHVVINALNYTAQQGTQVASDHVGYFDQGDWLQYSNIDFGDSDFNLLSLTIAVDPTSAGGELEVRTGSIDGPIVAHFRVENTGGWTDFNKQTVNLEPTNGTHSLFVLGRKGNGIANLKSIELHQGEPIPAPTLASINIFPNEALLTPDESIAFEVYGYDSQGFSYDLAEHEISWSTNIGSIDDDGQLTSGFTQGEAQVMATVNLEGNTVSAIATVMFSDGEQILDDVIWAENAGGAGYQAKDDISYRADTHFRSSQTIHSFNQIKGTPDATLYQSTRSGDTIEFSYPITNGTYNIHLKFGEVTNLDSNFSVFAEDALKKSAINIVGSRDGQRNANYDLSFDQITVNDGELNIVIEGENPSISGIVITQAKAQSQWQLVWADEFDGDTIDSEKWTLEQWAPGHVNNELQRYTDRAENARVENGHLVIEARKDNYQGAEYSSARLHSANKGDLLYGRIEVRAKLPNGKGTWPAIWMMPSDVYKYATTCSASTGWTANCDAWPNSGEIDIMEHVGFDEGHSWATVHNKAYYWVNSQQRKGAVWDTSLTEAFHVYAIEWTPERIDIYKDDIRYFTYVNTNEGWESWPYDHPFHVILNLAVGGNWGGAQGVDTNIWPKQMLVDYVRMYKAE